MNGGDVGDEIVHAGQLVQAGEDTETKGETEQTHRRKAQELQGVTFSRLPASTLLDPPSFFTR